MSSRQTMSRYMGKGGGHSGGNSGGPGWLSQMTGKDQVTGGELTTDPQTGQPSVTPFQGSSGLLGGWSRRQAMQANLPLLLQQLQGRQTSALSTQESGQRQTEAAMANKLAEHMMNTKAFIDFAAKNGMSPDEAKNYAAAISKETASNIIQQQQNIGAALKRPDVAQTEADRIMGENRTPDAMNRLRTKQDVGPMGVSSMPGPNGGAPTTLYGGMPSQTTALEETGMMDPRTGHRMNLTPVINQNPVPGRISSPVNPDLLNAAGQIQPQDNSGQMQPLPIPSPQNPGASINNGMPGSGTGNSLQDYIRSANGIASGTSPQVNLVGGMNNGNPAMPIQQNANPQQSFGQEGAQGNQMGAALLQYLLTNPMAGFGQ